MKIIFKGKNIYIKCVWQNKQLIVIYQNLDARHLLRLEKQIKNEGKIYKVKNIPVFSKVRKQGNLIKLIQEKF